MNKEKSYLIAEIKKIEIDKWDEGVRTHTDPGNEYVLRWVEQNGQWFRDRWDSSVCSTCENCEECGYCLLSACENHIRAN